MHTLLSSSNPTERERESEERERESEFAFRATKHSCSILEFGKAIYKFNAYEWAMHFYGTLIGWDKPYDIKRKHAWQACFC